MKGRSKKFEKLIFGVTAIVAVCLVLIVCQRIFDKQVEVDDVTEKSELLQKESSELESTSVIQEEFSESEIIIVDNEQFEETESTNGEFETKKVEYIELQEELPNVSNSDELPILFPVDENSVGRTVFGGLSKAIVSANELVGCDQYSKIRLHCKVNPPIRILDAMEGKLEVVDDWELTCHTDEGKEVQIEKDNNNPDYYYIVLEQKGSYFFEKKYKDLTGEKRNQYFCIKW